MADFRVKTGLRTHYKRKKLNRVLGPEGLVALYDLWSFCAESRTNGDLSGMSDEDIAITVDYPDDRDLAGFARTLAAIGFLDGPEGARKVHKWGKHNAYVAYHSQRSDRAKKAAESRWSKSSKPPTNRPSGNNGTAQLDVFEKHDDTGRYAKSTIEHCSISKVAMLDQQSSNAKSESSNAPYPDPYPDPDPDPEEILSSSTQCAETTQNQTTVTQLDVRENRNPHQNPSRARDVDLVWACYHRYHPRAAESLTAKSKERRYIVARLDEGYSAEDLCTAVIGCHTHPWNTGQDPKTHGKKYLGISVALKSASQVDRFIEHANSGDTHIKVTSLSEKGQNTLTAAKEWIERSDAAESDEGGKDE